MVMRRPQIKATIKEDIKNDLEELCGLKYEDIPHKIFAINSKNGTHEILSIPNDELCKLSHRVNSGDVVHLSPTCAGRIRFLLNCQKHLTDQGL